MMCHCCSVLHLRNKSIVPHELVEVPTKNGPLYVCEYCDGPTLELIQDNNDSE